MKIYLRIIVFINVIFNSYLNAATTSFQQGVDGYSGSRDTALIGAGAWGDYDFSSFDELGISLNSRQGLLRFTNIFGNLTGQIPSDSSIQSATLELTRFSYTTTSNASGYRVLSYWSDTDTYNSLGNGLQTNGIEAAFTPDFSSLGDGSIARLSPQSFDVLEAVSYWQTNPSLNYGWVLSGGNSSTLQIASSDYSNISYRPRLVVEFAPSPVPLPQGIYLFLSGLVGLGLIRGRIG